MTIFDDTNIHHINFSSQIYSELFYNSLLKKQINNSGKSKTTTTTACLVVICFGLLPNKQQLHIPFRRKLSVSVISTSLASLNPPSSKHQVTNSQKHIIKHK